jgi:hypothetical protein
VTRDKVYASGLVGKHHARDLVAGLYRDLKGPTAPRGRYRGNEQVTCQIIEVSWREYQCGPLTGLLPTNARVQHNADKIASGRHVAIPNHQPIRAIR